MAPSPRVSTESGTTRNASAGQTTALAMPTTNPASKASQNESIENPGKMAASSHSPAVVTTVTTIVRHRTVRHDGRSAAGRTTRDVWVIPSDRATWRRPSHHVVRVIDRSGESAECRRSASLRPASRSRSIPAPPVLDASDQSRDLCDAGGISSVDDGRNRGWRTGRRARVRRADVSHGAGIAATREACDVRGQHVALEYVRDGCKVFLRYIDRPIHVVMREQRR